MIVEERKYCEDNCGTILNDNSYRPHKKYCDNCNAVRNDVRCKKAQDKYREKYLEHKRQKYKEAKIHA